MPEPKEFQATPTLEEIREMAAQSGGAAQGASAPGLIDPTSKGQLLDTSQPPPGEVPRGVGSAYAANQEVSGGKLSTATSEGLEALNREKEREAAKKRAAELRQQEEDAKAEEEARAAANLGGFDYETFRSLVADNPFLSPELKDAIEANLAPIPIKDLVLGRGKQAVVIVPGELEVVFQTVKGHEDLLIKRLMRDDADQLGVYFDDKKAVLNLAIGLAEINGQPLPQLADPKDNGRTSEASLTVRFNALLEMSIQAIAFLAVNYGWFDYRVKKTLTPTNLKNG